MNYNAIHETVIADILDTMREGLRVKDAVFRSRPNISTANSLTRATSALTLAFPVLCSDTLSVDVAVMVAKAIERKNISLLQMAFSAFNVTNSADAIDYLAAFHTNLNLDKLNLDQFINIMDGLGDVIEGSSMISKQDMVAIIEDCKRNLNYILGDNINENSLLEYSQVSNYGNTKIIREAGKSGSGVLRGIDKNTGKERSLTDKEIETLATGRSPFNIDMTAPNTPTAKDAREQIKWNQQQKDRINTATAAAEDRANREKNDEEERLYRQGRDATSDEFTRRKIRNDERRTGIEQDKLDLDRDKHDLDIAKAMGQAADQQRQYLQNQLLPSDVKKANEMQPSLMLVQFYTSDQAKSLNIAQQFVAGVKSKLYPIPSSDIVNKIITKHADSNILLKLIKVSTREISFVKDFLLGLDQARLDALSKSRRNSASKIFKALEKRAIKGKIRKSLRMENAAKAITTLAISMEEVDELKKYNNIDVMNPRIIIPVMEKLNLLYFVIVDTTSEAIHILSDGDTIYEEYSFTSLERENGDGTYKKVINLLTKAV